MRGKREPLKPTALPDPDQGKGISQAELCRRSGIDGKHLGRAAKARGLTSQQWVEQQTGWIYRSGKYYEQ